MDTACLRIKFTSLIKKLQTEDSKCCLEIVPEVSCLQNFDKIQWKRGDNLYEYVIPMTYKIIVKRCKQYTGKYKVDCTLHQIYHSCVDLLHTSSAGPVEEAKYINRIFSEPMLLTPINMPKCDMILPQPKDINNPEYRVSASAQTYEEIDVLSCTADANSDKNKAKNGTHSAKSGTENHVMHNIDIQFDSYDNIMNLINECAEDIQKRPNQNTFDAENIVLHKTVNPIPVKSHVDPKSILSLTPICSINTEDAPSLSQYENKCHPNSVIIYDNNGYYRNILSYDYLAPLTNLKQYLPYTHFDDFKCMEMYNQRPDVRIENFLKLIEDEIVPLKCMLNDIVSKFTSLNIDSKLLKSWLDTGKINKLEKYKSLNRQNSNRVIYTVVFDG